MLTIILHNDSDVPVIEVISDSQLSTRMSMEHIVVIDEAGEWTDSPSRFTEQTEDEQAETIAAYRNEGYEDRNP